MAALGYNHTLIKMPENATRPVGVLGGNVEGSHIYIGSQLQRAWTGPKVPTGNCLQGRRKPPVGPWPSTIQLCAQIKATLMGILLKNSFSERKEHTRKGPASPKCLSSPFPLKQWYVHCYVPQSHVSPITAWNWVNWVKLDLTLQMNPVTTNHETLKHLSCTIRISAFQMR